MVYYAFVDLVKAINRVLKEAVKCALRKLMAKEWLVQVVISIYVVQ